MDMKLVALKLFLDALGVGSSIVTVADRKRIQKAVYLGQLSGADLGYRYGWYIMGPYSTSLTRDYFELSELVQTEGPELDGRQLRPEFQQPLSSIAPLLTVPDDIPLEQEDWLELLASYDYLRRVSRYSHTQAITLLKEQKSHIVAYVDQAIAALRKHHLDQYPK